MSTLMLRTSTLSLNSSCYYNHHSWQGREKQGHPSRTAMIVMAKNRGPAVEIGKSAAANVPICKTATPSGTSRDIEEPAASSVAATKLLAKNLQQHQHQQAMNSSSNSSSSSSRSTKNNKNNHSTTTSTRPQQLQKTATNIHPSPAAAWACDSLERALVKIFAGSDIGGAAHSDHDRKHSSNFFLNGCFEPVAHETSPVSNLPVSGSIPECLNGQFMQVVPNPRFSPVADYHWFDGDGVLHGLNIKNGKATYMSRFVRTSKLQQEEYYGAAKFLKIGDMVGIKGILFFLLHLLRIKLGVLDISHGVGTANTALVYHNRKLLALYEGDKPYAIRVLEDGDLETIGQEDYGGKLTNNFTAHPKIDPVTGEMFGMCYDVMASPYLTYQVFSKGGDLMAPVPITLQDSAIMHDFAITENYAIFMDPPVAVNVKNLARGEHVIKFDPSKESRLGLLPRYAQNESQIRWFTIPTCMIIHSANAWEEGDEVVLVLTRRARIDFDAMGTGFQHKKWMDSPSQLYKYRINLKTGQVTQRELSIPEMQTDYPKINDKYLGRRQRYVYGCIFNDTPKVVGVVKYDVSVEPELPPQDLKVGGNIKGLFLHGDGRYGSEVFFVPRNTVGKDVQEDDGYLLCFVHDENIGNSEVVIIDAKTMASKPVAVVSLPARVPAGFHTIFVSETCMYDVRFYQACPGQTQLVEDWEWIDKKTEMIKRLRNCMLSHRSFYKERIPIEEVFQQLQCTREELLKFDNF